MYIFNFINFTKLCRLLATFFNTQKTFQGCLNVVVRVIWLCDIGQYWINVETTLCMYTLKFTTLSNVRLTLSISTLILTTLDVEFHNVDQRQNNVLYMTIFKKLKRAKKYFWVSKKKVSHLINNTCFQLWLIKKKSKHGTYNIKINFGKYNAWYMKRIWK